MFTHTALRAAVGEAHNEPVSTITRIEPGRNHTYVVRFRDGRRLFLKVGTRFPEVFPAEPETMTLVRRETSIPVPEVHATGRTPLDYPFAVYEFVEDCGEDWVRDLPRNTARRLCREAGDHLAELHELTFPAFGRLGPGNDGLRVVEERSYRERLRASLDRQLSELGDTPFAEFRDPLRLSGQRAIERIDTDAVRPGLVHGDYRPDNLCIDPRSERVTTAVLDWERPTAGDPLWDAIMTVAVLTEGYEIDPTDRRAYRDAFWAGYGDPPSGRARWQCYELLARVRLARHLGTEMAGMDDGAVSARISDHTDAFRELLDGDSRFERSPNAT